MEIHNHTWNYWNHWEFQFGANFGLFFSKGCLLKTMPRHLVYVSRRDCLRQPLGAAWVVKEITDEFVRVKFVVDRRKYIVKRWHINFDYTPDEKLRCKKKRRKELQVTKKTKRVKSASRVENRSASKATKATKPKSVGVAAASVMQSCGVSTWERLLRFGEACSAHGLFSRETVLSFGALVLPDSACKWLFDKHDLVSDMQDYVSVWCNYCGALAHCDFSRLDVRTKLLVLNVICDDIERGGHTGNVFASLFLQLAVTSRHDQSVCSIVANIDNIGYAKRIDRAKVGVLVSSKALLRNEKDYAAAKRAINKFRKPLQTAVWQIKSNAEANTFMRVPRGRLYCFPTDSGVASRLHPETNIIKYWSAEVEQYVPRDEFFTTVDGVAFKKVVDLKVGDEVLYKRAEEKPQSHKVTECINERKTVKLRLQSNKVAFGLRKSKQDYLLTKIAGGVDDVKCLLRNCPDVVDSLCLSVGHPEAYMKKRVFKVCDMKAATKPMKLSFDEYVIWRCAVSLVVSVLKRRRRTRATHFEKLARTNLLTRLD